jgi:methylmalonyl-CoA carboxyltransferase small subunit
MKLQINIDGRQYEADIEVLEEEQRETVAAKPTRHVAKHAHTQAAAPPAHEEPAAATASNAKVCKSPIAGIVVSVLVKVGQDVKVGDSLVVLEAMKMESNVSSTHAGHVKAVHVAQGSSVKKGQVLVEFE